MSSKKAKPSKDQKKVDQGRNRTRYGVRASGAISRAKVEEMNNALAYVRQILNPEDSPSCVARMPEPTPYPSSVSHHKFLNSLISITDAAAGGDKCGGIIITPFMQKAFYGLTAYNSGTGAETWSVNAHPALASFTSNFALWRCVGLSVRVYCTTTLLNRGGTLYMFRGFLNGVPTAGGTPITDMRSSSEYTTIDLANLGPEGVMLPWLPLTLQSTVFDTSRAVDMQPTGSSYRLDLNGDVNGEDTFIGFFYNATLIQNVQFEITSCWEHIPIQSTKQLFETEAVVGDTGDIATAYQILDKNLNTRGASTTGPDVLTQMTMKVGNIVNTVGDAIGHSIDLAKNVASNPVFRGIAQTASSLYSLFGGVSGGMESTLTHTRARFLLSLHEMFPELDTSSSDFLNLLLDKKISHKKFFERVQLLLEPDDADYGSCTGSVDDKECLPPDLERPQLRREETSVLPKRRSRFPL